MVSTVPHAALAVSPTRLAAAFAAVPDPRRAGRVLYPLPALLSLAVAEWGARQRPEVLRVLGFPAGRTPCQSTLQRVFRQLDGDALSATLTQCLVPSAAPPSPTAAAQGIAIDGKAHRGRLRFAPRGCPVHALSAFCHEHGVVLAHEPIDAAVGTDKTELTVAPTLIDRLDWHGRVLTGDALFCQRTLCQQVGNAGGD